MKVVAINTVAAPDNAPGRIMTDICSAAAHAGNDVIAIYGRGRMPVLDKVASGRMGCKAGVLYHTLMSRITDREGLYSATATRRLIAFLEKENPDIIHLHNIHGHYMNYPILMSWLRESGMPVVWTMHDEWAFTGHCASYFDCTAWQHGCYSCQRKYSYPKSILANNSASNYARKRDMFTSLDNLTIVAVSRWLADELKRSFFADKPITVIPNGVDTGIFCPQPVATSNGTFNILGVASRWDKVKGLDAFIELAGIVGDGCRITLVGNTGWRRLPKSINAVGHVSSLQELARLYSSADLFINPSAIESFGMTTVEALACGTPVIVNNRTALPECVTHDTGIAVNTDNTGELVSAINEIRDNGKPYYSNRCVSYIRDNYSTVSMSASYLSLYNSLLSL